MTDSTELSQRAVAAGFTWRRGMTDRHGRLVTASLEGFVHFASGGSYPLSEVRPDMGDPGTVLLLLDVAREKWRAAAVGIDHDTFPGQVEVKLFNRLATDSTGSTARCFLGDDLGGAVVEALETAPKFYAMISGIPITPVDGTTITVE